MRKPTIVITGASGFVGQELVAYFSKQNWQVVGLVRQPANYPKPGKNVVYKAYDMTKPLDDTLLRGADYLVHTAYMKYDRAHPDAMDVNVSAAQQLHDAARRHKIKKTVFMSTMSAHEEAVSVYGKQKLAIEQLFATSHDVVLRCGLIIGTGGIVHEMVGFLRTKRAVPVVDGGRQPLQIISVYNLVRVIEQVLVKDMHGLFTIVNPRVYEYKELYQTIAQMIGVRIALVPVPFFVLLTAVRLFTWLHIPIPVNEDNLWGLKMLRATDNAADMKRIGVPLDDLAAALKRTGIAT